MSEPLEEEYGLSEFLVGELTSEQCEEVKRRWAESLVEAEGYNKEAIGKVEAVVTLNVYPREEYKPEDLL
jgi:hypothetical protein